MIAAILIWASQKKGDEELKQNNNEPINYVTRTTSQRARPSIPEYLIIAWLCGNIHKLFLPVLNLKDC